MTKSALFWVYFQVERLVYNLQNQFFWQFSSSKKTYISQTFTRLSESCLGCARALFFWQTKPLFRVNFQTRRLVNHLKNEDFLGIIDKLGQFRGSISTSYGSKKVVFWTFLKLFWSCLGSVWALFSTLKGPLCVYF